MTTLTLPHVALNYQLIGVDPATSPTPIVMIHGLGANLSFWFLGAVRYLGRDRALLLPDLRGHGASSMPDRGYGLDQMARDMFAVMDAAGIDRAHLVGHSHGARVAIVMAQQQPDRFASLTIADTQLRELQPAMRLRDWAHWPVWKKQLAAEGVTSFPDEESEIDFRLLASLGPRGGAALASGNLAERGPRARAARAAGPGGAGGGRRRGINLRSRQMGARGAARWQELVSHTTVSHDLEDESAVAIDRLSELALPVLLIYGAQSHCLPTSDALLQRLPGARRIVVPGAGHFFPIVKPRLFARALATFLAGVDSPGLAARRRDAARRLGRPGLRAALKRRGA
ncbi:alpha/beta fold hydrolase [Roseivivax sp. CAU 1753]